MALSEATEAVVVAVGDFSRELRLSIDKQASLLSLTKLPPLGDTIAEAGPMKLSWFDDGRRRELQSLSAKCQAELAACNELRQRLASRMDDFAFSQEGEELAEEAAPLEQFGRRLLACISGRWYWLKRCAKSLYTDKRLGKSREMMHDLRQLRDFHARRSAVRFEETAARNDLIYDSGGVADWQRVSRGTEAIDRLRAMISIPDRLKQCLSSDGLVDRAALKRASGRVADALATLSARAEELQARFDLNFPEGSALRYVDLPLEKFSDWLSQAVSDVRKEQSNLEGICGFFESETDIPIAEIADRFKQLSDFQKLEHWYEDQRGELGTLAGVPMGRDNAEWSRCTEIARALERFLDQYGDPPVTNALRVVTDADVRSAVESAVADVERLFESPISDDWRTLDEMFPGDEVVSTGQMLSRLPLVELSAWLRQRLSDAHLIQEWCFFRESESVLGRLGATTVVNELLAKEVTIDDAVASFLTRFYKLWLDSAYTQHQVLREFRSEEHDGLIDRFKDLDRESIEDAFKRIRMCALGNPARPHSGMLAPSNSEVGILMREAQKKRRHLALRQLFGRIPTLLTRLKPCVMMSPLAVSTYLASPEIKFDLVIFDEASQVRPFDAVGAIYRGRQLVVAGDQKQLPPTSFFDRMASDDGGDEEPDDDEPQAAIQDFESILDVCRSIGLPHKRLRWHYRSRREPLIAFSNHHFYANELYTFPSVMDADDKTAVAFNFVESGRWRPGREGGDNPEEARRVAELVFDSFAKHPEESLAVITFNQKQQFAVLDELERHLRARPEMESFFADANKEPFFVKNLENVQGDERDRIILGVGYGYDAQGKFAMRFGPINRQGGERRLNVAVTRAKHQVTVVSSIHSTDIDLSRAKSAGAKILRAYLQYAEQGTSSLGGEISEDSQREPDSPFEREVEQAIRLQGLDVRRQVGCARYRIDLALVHPKNPGRYVLAIECDGATYHRWATARDRDRLRQDVLTSLGWKFCRIWSTDWVRNPQQQVDRVLKAYHEALKLPDGGGVGVGTCSLNNTRPEQPVIRMRGSRSTEATGRQSVSQIRDVSSAGLAEIIVRVLRRFGQTPQDEVVKVVAKELGFQRAGKTIQSRVKRQISRMISQKSLKRLEGNVLAIN